MNSNEYWEGYHSFNNRQKVEDCPYRFEPQSARDWKSGFAKAKSESK